MSSNIEIQKICQFCNNQFTAKKTTTKYCSLKCSSKAYKQRDKNKKIENTNLETITIKNKTLLNIKLKEYLTVKEVSLLLGFSARTIYRLIKQNKVIAYNFSERMTVIKRSDIDALFETPDPEFEIVIRRVEKKKQAEIKDCYTITEIQKKFNISNGALYNLLKRKNVPKFSKGKFTYVAKNDIEALF